MKTFEDYQLQGKPIHRIELTSRDNSVTLNMFEIETFRCWVEALKLYTVYLKDIKEDYGLEECIGAGNFGKVVKAKDYYNNSSVAIKIFSRSDL